MAPIDFVIFGVYLLGVLGIGFYHFLRNKDAEDYYVGGRNIKAPYVGLSLVATDVGGGFSIGLGGVGFLMGLGGSWLLFTGLLGAWLSAVFIIPKIKLLDKANNMFTYPDFLRHRYNNNVALVAALISAIGYMAFTGAQILAGATLASATLIRTAPFGLTPMNFSLIIIAIVCIGYTVIGGIKAVIYTDAAQWAILLFGLMFVTIPVTLWRIGGISRLREELPAEFFSLANIDAATFVNWMLTITPIWLIGMTIYQRFYACKNEKEAKRAWYIAGVFEYPIMAFSGVFLGMCARVLFPEADPEAALPMLIRDMLPIGVTGLIIAAYFSAIMSTADSCMMASSGNVVTDIIKRHLWPGITHKTLMRVSQVVTLLIGVGALVIASSFTMVLDAIMHAYGFMVSGLFIPTVGAYFWKRASSAGALSAMLLGGATTMALQILGWQLGWDHALEYTVYGMAVSLVVFITISLLVPDRPKIISEGHTYERQDGEAAELSDTARR